MMGLKQFVVSTVFCCIGVMLGGCAGGVGNINDSLADEHSPIRFFEDQDRLGEGRYIEDWAGAPGESITGNTKFRVGALKLIEDRCGHKESELLETRVVKHSAQAWEEVWVFSDAKSYRLDKTSALTVLITYDPDADVSDLELFGGCHKVMGRATFTFD